MKLRSLTTIALGICATVAFAGVASADTLAISSPSWRTGNGGEFEITGFDDAIYGPGPGSSSATSFYSFCLEYNEYINLPGSYSYEIGASAISGGAGGPSPDPISEATAKLYYTFWTDQWDAGDAYGYDLDYDYGSGSARGADGRDLQLALWYLEDEIAYSALTDAAKALVDYALEVEWEDLGQAGWDDDNASTEDIGAVRVVNLYRIDPSTGARTEHQSQLVVVPLPLSALMGLGLLAGLGAVMLVRRRRRMHGFA